MHALRFKFVPLISGLLLALTPVARAAATAPTGTVFRATLDNGMRVIVVRNPLAPVVTTVINYQVGSNDAPAGFPGMAHATEHMMFRGSKALSADQLAAISAAMGGDFDADTQQELTQYFFSVPKENLSLALRIEAARMLNPLPVESLWTAERGAIEQEVSQDLSNPEYVMYAKLLAIMFKGTVYEHDALGTRPSFDATTNVMLKKFHDTWYAPNNAILIVCGDVDPATTMAQVKKLFGGFHPLKLPAHPTVKLEPVKPELLNIPTDLPNGLAVIAFRMPGYDSPDFAAADVLGDVLGNKRGRFYSLVPEGKALDVEFDYNPLNQAGLGYAVAQFPKGGDGAAMLELMKNAIAADLKEGFNPDLVEAEKRHEVADAEFGKNSISGLAMAWSQAVAGEGRNSPDDDINAVRKVTVADVNRVAHQYLDFNQAVTAILTPTESGKPLSTQSYGGRESLAATPTKAVKLPGWAAKELDKLTIPESTLHPVVTNLSNGLQLIVQPESISQSITISGHIKNRPELEAPKGQDGVDVLLGQFFDYGTRTLDRVAFQKALDDIGANESGGTDFSLQVLTDQFDHGLQLLADNELHPAFPEDAFKILQEQVAGSVAGRLHSPDYRTNRALLAGLYPKDDPRLREVTPATVNALTLADVQGYYQHVFRPDLTTIVVIGDITPEKAQAAVEKYFDDWKAEGPKPETLLPPVPLSKPSATVVPNATRVQDKVLLAETIGLTRTNADYYPLELGNHVLGGGFYATRLYRDLRKNAGLVYSVESIFQIELSRAVYLVEYACDPGNVSRARQLVIDNLNRMQKSLVSDEELHQAKAQVLRAIPLGESDIGSIAGGLLYRATHDLPLDEPVRAAHRYVGMTAAEIKAAYVKWLRPDDLVQVTEGSPPK